LMKGREIKIKFTEFEENRQTTYKIKENKR
jgi:hypothetical protein